MTDDEHDGRLKECLTTVQTLEEENRQLRQSADSFGQLAERLNQELARERRSVDADRRREPRDSPDRRSHSQQP
jgi:predicted RNase H-like nuclease (RuvC/YqgF family)